VYIPDTSKAADPGDRNRSIMNNPIILKNLVIRIKPSLTLQPVIDPVFHIY
jgi:hypothetical protein